MITDKNIPTVLEELIWHLMEKAKSDEEWRELSDILWADRCVICGERATNETANRCDDHPL